MSNRFLSMSLVLVLFLVLHEFGHKLNFRSLKST